MPRPQTITGVLALSCSVASGSMSAQLAPPAAGFAEAEIVVTGFSSQFTLGPKQLKAAQRTFTAKRGAFAPSSQLYFQVRSHDGGDVADLSLYLRRGEDIVRLNLDSQSRFILPVLSGGDWSLFANRNQKHIVIAPTVNSPGTDDLHRLIGDLRLQCEVSWAMSKSETSIVARAMFSAAGGCAGNKFGYYVTTASAIRSGVVNDGQKGEPLQLWGHNRYQAPIGNKNLSNTARVTLVQL